MPIPFSAMEHRDSGMTFQKKERSFVGATPLTYGIRMTETMEPTRPRSMRIETEIFSLRDMLTW